ncbi:MAG TPA: hypothetical protein VF767_11195 [Bryobacteraceae bacterium]
MPDRLNLSLWARHFEAGTMLRHFEELLGVFPFSHLRPGIGALRIYAVAYSEPTLFEQAFSQPVETAEIFELCREFEHEDCAYAVEGWWELWRYERDWQLAPSPVVLTCFGPAFEHDLEDHLRLDLGLESDFLPRPGAPQNERKSQSNLASLVRLARDIGGAMPIERRSLWSDSGESFADRLEDELPGR